MSTNSEVVTSVGNSWIICRSKTYSGRIYYFNTLTGEAAWNLSESEIEKAKKRTSMLESQTGFQIDNCPEPMDLPQDQSNLLPLHSNKQQIPLQNVVPSKVYNKQIINNTFPKSPYSYVGHLPPLSALNPIQLNIPITPTLNSGIWNVTPQAILVTPSVINQQPVMNNTFNKYDYVPVTNTSVPLTSRFKNLGQNYAKSVPLQKKSQMNIEDTLCDRKNNSRNLCHNSKDNVDLRLLLSSKKRKTKKCEFNETEDFSKEGYCNVVVNGQIQGPEKRNSNVCNSWDQNYDDDDDIWLQENLKKRSFKELLDLSPIKKLLHIENNFEMWYIVFDSNVLLNNINFINIVLNSDKQCRLMVPQIIMDKIQVSTNSRRRTQAHRAAYFISQQVDANVAVIDKSYEEVKTDDKEIIKNCCSKLTDQGYPVVLLTDDIELNNLKNNSHFIVFTVRELKKILCKPIAQGPTNNKFEELALSQSRNIKITIPNNVNNKFVEENKSSSLDYHDEAYFEVKRMKSSEDSPCERTGRDFIEINEMHKNTDDVGVQVNSELDEVQESNSKIVGTLFSNVNQNILCKTKGVSANPKTFNNNNLKLNNTGLTEIKCYNTKTKPCLSMVISSLDSKGNEIEQTSVVEESHKFNYKNLANDSSYASSGTLPHCNYDENSEGSGDIRKNLCENFLAEETSTSEISCKSSILNVENAQSIPAKTNDLFKEKHLVHKSINEDKNVMFEVTSSAMEDCLRRKSDEWISRFVQIIEEASTQVLQLDPPFILDTMLPPWTIYEATECIKRKFSNDNDIVDASNKLLNVLFEIGGLRGKIKIDIGPNKYMEMYSYGVYLIDALQGLLTNSEDLQVAAESLSKLLDDIQDSHLYPDSQDSFTDNRPPENVVNESDDKTSDEKEIIKTASPAKVVSLDHSEKINMQVKNKSTTKKTSCENIISSPGSYNLRSHKKKLLQEKEEFSKKITFIRNIDLESSFFTSLHLQKNLYRNNDIRTDVNQSLNENNVENGDEYVIPNKENSCENDGRIDANIDSAEPEKNNISNEPKVIRNFTKCLEFENRIKNKLKQESLTYDSWTYKNESYHNEIECEEDEQIDYSLFENQYYSEDYEYEMSGVEEMSDVNSLGGRSESKENLNSSVEKTTINFKEIIDKIEHNIREAFSTIHRFCEKCYTTLNSDVHNLEKKEMQRLAEDTHSYLKKLCDALNSILTRETSDSSCKMQELLKIEELNEIIVESGDLEAYRNFINKCIEQGNILKDSVQLVIDASRE